MVTCLDQINFLAAFIQLQDSTKQYSLMTEFFWKKQWTQGTEFNNFC